MLGGLGVLDGWPIWATTIQKEVMGVMGVIIVWVGLTGVDHLV